MEAPVKTKSGNIAESTLIAALAALGFIAWGLYVNWEHGIASRIQVALTQGAISFIATFGSAELLRKTSQHLADWRCVAAAGWGLINILVFLAHWIFGTPEILITMIPGMLTGAIFCFAYARRLG